MKKSIYRIFGSILVSTIIIIIIINNSEIKPRIPHSVSNQLDKKSNQEFYKTKEYNGFPLPYGLGEDEVERSLKTKTYIIINKKIDINWIDQASEIAKNNGRTILHKRQANDGGSKLISYIKKENKIGMDIIYHRNMMEGGYESMSIRLISPSNLDSRLTEISGEILLENQ